MSKWGEPIAPALRITSPASRRIGSPLWLARTPTVEQDLTNRRIGQDGQVRSLTCRIQVAQGGAPANAVHGVQRNCADSGGSRCVMVRALWKTQCLAGFDEGRLR